MYEYEVIVEPKLMIHAFHPVNFRQLMVLDERVEPPRRRVEDGPTRTSDILLIERHGPYVYDRTQSQSDKSWTSGPLRAKSLLENFGSGSGPCPQLPALRDFSSSIPTEIIVEYVS